MEGYVEDTADVIIKISDEDTAMEEEEPTQPDPYFAATQKFMDPRRLGQHSSGLDDEDLPDIFCILHPASLPACQAIAQIAEDSPQHTIGVSGVELKVRDAPMKEPHRSDDEPGTFELATQGIVSHDIALRLSAKLKNPLFGFCFGRNPQRCDFVLATDDPNITKRISNIHFRIYINEHGVIMLEDQSTNGTTVDGVNLHGKDKENSHSRHTLDQGSLISLHMTPPDPDMIFVVRIPRREGYFEDLYEKNLDNYFSRLRAVNDAREAQRAKPNGGNVPAIGPPDLFGQPGVGTKSLSVTTAVDNHRYKEWKGGEKYNRSGTIGKGAFATVYLVTTKYDGTHYAAKELEKRRFIKDGILNQKVDMEMQIMRKIKHPHIVQFIEHVDWEKYMYLIMEYVPGGDLTKLVSARGQLPEPMVVSIADQMLGALEYLHGQNVTHRDIKPDNILIQSVEPLQVKLADFGLSKVIDKEDTFLRTFCGTLLYCAPEVYSEYREYDIASGLRIKRKRGKENLPPQRYNHRIDLYSLGAVLFYSFCGSPPYPADSSTTYLELLHVIMTKALDIRPLQRAGASENGIRVVKSMLHLQPEHRPSIGRLQSDRWLTGVGYSMELDDDDDDGESGYQVGLDVDEVGNKTLQHGASQLSLQDDETIGSQLDYYDEDIEAEDDEVELIRAVAGAPEIPDSQSAESFAFMRNPPEKGRLFGEINASALGSSGVIPRGQLNLPFSQSYQELDNDGYNTNSSARTSPNPLPPTMDAPNNGGVQSVGSQNAAGSLGHRTSPSTEEIPTTPQYSAGPVTAPSLMGAESMVGNLQMNSPSPVAMSPLQPPMIQSPGGTTTLNQSVRRPREDGDQEESRPDPKRHKSDRQINLILSKQTFWNARDKSTWHSNYPEMTLSEYNSAEETAKARGESFEHGHPYFDMLVSEYTQNTEPIMRAESEPVVEQGRRAMMKRDSRTMDDMINSGSAMPATATPTMFGDLSTNATPSFTQPKLAMTGNNDDSLPATQVQSMLPSDDSTFATPQKILARLATTPESVLQITLNITDSETTWGRAHTNSMLHNNKQDVRIPKNGLKLVQLGPDQNFYVSTKASAGILVNDVELQSNDSKEVDAPWKYWGELKSGDVVTVYRHGELFIKFIFDCFVGASAGLRTQPFTVEELAM